MKKAFLLRFFAVILVALLFSQIALPAYTVYAGREGAGGWSEEPDIAEPEVDDDEPEARPEEEMSFIEKFLCEFLTAVGDQLNNLLELAGISLDGIIYGRNSGSNVALFTFELKPGNPYGLVGASLYKVFRSISFAAIGVIVFGKLATHSFLKMTPQNLERSKSAFLHLVLSFLLLMLMPYLVDMVLNLRDSLIHLVMSSATRTLFGRSMNSVDISLIDVLRAEAGERIVGGVVYIAAIVYTLYLAFLYAGYAMAFLVSFASFPLIAIASSFKQDLLRTWMSTVSYYVLVPVIDGALLLIPAFMVNNDIAGIVVLFSCMCMTKARGILAHLLGVQDSGGGAMGFAAMMAATRLVGSAVKAGKTAVGLMAGASADSDMANYESDMASASGETLSAHEAGIESASPRQGASGDASAAVSTSSGGVSGATVSAPSGGVSGATVSAPSGGVSGATVSAPSGGVSGATVSAPSGGVSGATVSAPSGGSTGADVAIYNSGSTGADVAIYDSGSTGADVAIYDSGSANAEIPIMPTTVASGNTAATSVDYSKIADKYANVNNFEYGPLSNQISHAKKAELYRKRARQRRKQAFGTVVGGTLGGLAGASAGLMLGPAATGAFASAGINAGSEVGGTVASHVPVTRGEVKEAGATIGQAGRKLGEVASKIHHTTTTYYGSASSNAGESVPITAPPVESVVGEVDIPASSEDIVVTQAAEESVNAHMRLNAQSILDSGNEMNSYYLYNEQAAMKAVYSEMKANNEFSDIDRDAARELFRERIYRQYMSKFNEKYDNHHARKFSSDAALEQSAKIEIANRIRSGLFNKNAEGSFVSDQSLDGYSWFDL